MYSKLGFPETGICRGFEMDVRLLWRASLFGAAVTLSIQAAQADPDITGAQLNQPATLRDDSDLGFRRGSFIVAPIPFSNPAIGSGLALGGGYLFSLDEDEETSFIGLGGLLSENGSEAYGVSAKLAFGSGWAFDLTFAEANLKYDLFVNQIAFPIEQKGLLGQGGLSRRVTNNWRIGAAFRYLDTTVTPNLGVTLPPELAPDLSLEILSLGLTAGWDIRDDTDYPTDGARLEISANRGYELGGSRRYGYASANFDAYHSLGAQTVLAGRASTCVASSDAPFFDQCSLGFSDQFRGFSPTQYYDQRLVSGQVELRHRLSDRIGVVTFGGVGWTGESYGRIGDAGTRVAGGLGVRYRLSKKFPVDFSVDYSTNNESEQFLYIFVGQRF